MQILKALGFFVAGVISLFTALFGIGIPPEDLFIAIKIIGIILFFFNGIFCFVISITFLTEQP